MGDEGFGQRHPLAVDPNGLMLHVLRTNFRRLAAIGRVGRHAPNGTPRRAPTSTP